MRFSSKITSLCIILFLASQSANGQQINTTYHTIHSGSNRAPAIIRPEKKTEKLSEAQKADSASVHNFALNQAQYIASKVLLLPSLATFEPIGTQRTGNLWLSSYIAFLNGIPIRERFMHINIGALSGEVILVRNNIPAKMPNALSAAMSESSITTQAINLLGIHSQIQSPPKLVFIDEKENPELRLCYEVIVNDSENYDVWRLTFDASDGHLIEQKSLVEHNCFVGAHCVCPMSDAPQIQEKAHAVCPYELPQSGVSGMVLAKVHLHSPFDTMTVVGLPYAIVNVNGTNLIADSTGAWSLPSAQYPVRVQTSFNSPYFSVLRQDNIPNSTLSKVFLTGDASVLWDNSNSDAAERDAYYSAAQAHIADKRLDEKLNGIDQHMKVNINFNAACNAFYIPKDTSINFFSAGPTCSNTAEISDVVFHEYGHRVTNARYTLAAGFNNNIVDGSLSEGFADLNSAFIRDDPRIGIGFFGDPKTTTKVIRSCDNTKKWPADISPDIHISGEIISGAFWDLRKMIGRDIAEHLFHFMEYQLPDGIGITDSASLEDAFTNTLAALILTDDDDNNLTNGTPHSKEILAAFKLHNITLARFLDANVAKVKDQDTSASQYPISLNVSYTGIIGGIDTASLKLFYSLDGKQFQSIPFQKNNNGFEADIPKAPAGSVITYYALCATTEGDTVITPAGNPYTFHVGSKQSVALSESISTLPFPNPIHRGEKLHLPDDTMQQVRITDLLGRALLLPDSQEFVIPNSFQSGIYFIEYAGERYKIIVF